MHEIITGIIAEQLVEIAAAGAIALAGIAATYLTTVAGRYIGEKRANAIRKRLDEAFGRALDLAEERGVTADQIQSEAVSYLQRTMGDTLKKLGVGRSDLLERAAAEMAKRAARQIF